RTGRQRPPTIGLLQAEWGERVAGLVECEDGYGDAAGQLREYRVGLTRPHARHWREPPDLPVQLVLVYAKPRTDAVSDVERAGGLAQHLGPAETYHVRDVALPQPLQA